MPRSTSGWVKSHRSELEKDLIQNVYLWAIWNFLELAAVWKPSEILWKSEKRILEPGQCLLKMREMADLWGCSTKTISKWLHYLEKTDRIALESVTHGTVVTIRNWKEIQHYEELEVTPSSDQVNTEETPRKHEGNYIKKSTTKEEKEEKKERRLHLVVAPPDLPPLALIWNEHKAPNLPGILKVEPTTKRGRAATRCWKENPNSEFWKTAIDRINHSPFCLGQSGSGWLANFDWLIRPGKVTEIFEGKFDHKADSPFSGNGHAPVTKAQRIEQANEAACAEWAAADALARGINES